MEYKIVELKKRTVVGKGVRVQNDAPDMVEKIGGVWGAFLGKDRLALNADDNTPTFGLYTNYDWSDSSYDMLAACESSVCPEGFRKVVIPGGKYAKFTFYGNVQVATAEKWGEIWQEKLPRACQVDFEEYSKPDEQGNAEISIYIGLADLCQSCGMPMATDEQRGTEQDGGKSGDYCCYCYQKGAFTADTTMEGMIDFCLNMEGAEKVYPDKAAARQEMMMYFPTLKRWKK